MVNLGHDWCPRQDSNSHPLDLSLVLEPLVHMTMLSTNILFIFPPFCFSFISFQTEILWCCVIKLAALFLPSCFRSLSWLLWGRPSCWLCAAVLIITETSLREGLTSSEWDHFRSLSWLWQGRPSHWQCVAAVYGCYNNNRDKSRGGFDIIWMGSFQVIVMTMTRKAFTLAVCGSSVWLLQ